MKTTNYFRNAALSLIFVLTASFSFSQGDNKVSCDMSREKAEFANAGYWIDAVVVNTGAEMSDRELLANKGYYIEPVVVTYRRNVPEYIDTPDGTVFFTMEKALQRLEVSMLSDDQAR